MAMSADCKVRAMVCSFFLCSSTLAIAEEDLPEADFLEYLGMWEASDAEWIMLDESMPTDTEERNETAPASEESVEKDDAR